MLTDRWGVGRGAVSAILLLYLKADIFQGKPVIVPFPDIHRFFDAEVAVGGVIGK